MKHAGLKTVIHLIGPLLLALLVLKVGPLKLWGLLQHAEIGWLLLAFILNLPQLGLKAWRWHRLVRWQGMRLSYGRALLAYFSSLLVGFLTPGRLGEMAKAITLKVECGVSFATGLSSVVVDRMFDMYLLLALGSVGILRFSFVGTQISWPSFLVICVVLALPLLFIHEHAARRLGLLAARLPGLNRKRAALESKVEQYAAGLSVLRPARVLECGVWTTLAYLIFFIQCLCCARGLGLNGIRLMDMSFMMAATNFISFVPISISGLGTREACLVYFMARLPVAYGTDQAVAFGLSLFLVLFVGGGLLGLASWQFAPLGLRAAIGDWKRTRHTEPQP
jgi:uncharacterized protein (TIRG00374 family)